MSGHSRNPHAGKPDPSSVRNGLLQAVADTGRGRFSSATPAPQSSILSPRPNRDLQAKIKKMNNSSFSTENFNQSIHSVESHGSLNSQQGVRLSPQRPTRNSTSSQASSASLRGNRGNNLSSTVSIPAESYNSQASLEGEAQQANVVKMAKEFQARIECLLAKIRNDSDIPTNLQASLVEYVQSVGQDFSQQHRKLQDVFERAVREKYQSVAQLEKARRDLQAATDDRDHAYQERDAHEKVIDEMQLKARLDQDRITKIETYWKEAHDKLLQRLTIQDEQLRGKRALWLDSNPVSSARRNAMNALQDPFNSPTEGSKAGGNMSNLGSPSLGSPLRNSFGPEATFGPQSSFGSQGSFGSQASFGTQAQYGPPPAFAPSKSNLSQQGLFDQQYGPHPTIRRRPNLQTQRAMPTPDMAGPYCSDNSRCYNTEPGTPSGDESSSIPRVSIRKDLEHLSDNELAELFTAEFSKIFALVEGFVKIYTSQPNLANDRRISSSNQTLWDFMLSCTYPGMRQDSHSHVMALLNDARSRYWFCMRIVAAYLTINIINIEVFGQFGARQEVELRAIKTKLSERGLCNEARQLLIDEQTEVVNGILSHPEYTTFKNNQCNFHSKRLRDVIGPLLNDEADRLQAGRDIGIIIVNAWALSVNLYTSHLTFQIYFPETASKFTAASMYCKDDNNRMSPLELQIKQVRLKLVITPVVVLRDDRGTTIKAKNLHNSSVLTMG